MIYSKEQKINMIWQQKHPDFRGMIGSDKSIMINADDGGGIGAICNFSDEMMSRYFDDAMKSYERDQSKKIALTIFKKHGALKLIDPGAVNQWCTDEKGIKELIGSFNFISDDVKKGMIADLETLTSIHENKDDSDLSI